MAKSILEKIKDKKLQYEIVENRIKEDQQKLKEIKAEIEILETQEIKGVLKELDIPIEELKDFITIAKLHKNN